MTSSGTAASSPTAGTPTTPATAKEHRRERRQHRLRHRRGHPAVRAAAARGCRPVSASECATVGVFAAIGTAATFALMLALMLRLDRA
jgi:hypothetical protein